MRITSDVVTLFELGDAKYQIVFSEDEAKIESSLRFQVKTSQRIEILHEYRCGKTVNKSTDIKVGDVEVEHLKETILIITSFLEENNLISQGKKL